MVEQGCIQDVVTYNSILKGMCNEMMLSDADNLFAEMVEMGIIPDCCTFTTHQWLL